MFLRILAPWVLDQSFKRTYVPLVHNTTCSIVHHVAHCSDTTCPIVFHDTHCSKHGSFSNLPLYPAPPVTLEPYHPTDRTPSKYLKYQSQKREGSLRGGYENLLVFSCRTVFSHQRKMYAPTSPRPCPSIPQQLLRIWFKAAK